MHINYVDKETEKLCKCPKYALKKMDAKVFKAISFVINFIENADSLTDIIQYPSFKFHDLEGDRKDEWSIYVKRTGYRIILKPQDENMNIIKKGDVIEKSKCIKIILITEVNNHYDE